MSMFNPLLMLYDNVDFNLKMSLLSMLLKNPLKNEPT